MKEHNCRVCGLYLGPDYLPWGEDGNCPTYDYCPCCGVEFGYQDYTIESIKQYREEWISKGANWSEPKIKPENWDKEEQFKNILQEFV